jgi:hypothetical protein
MKKTHPITRGNDRKLAELRRKIAALEKQLRRLDKAAAAKRAPRRLVAEELVVYSLKVVDATGRLVAEIDAKGNLFSRTVWASTDKHVRGVFLDGGATRKVSAGMVELIGETGNAPDLVATGRPDGGRIELKSRKDRQWLKLAASGAPIRAGEHTRGAEAAVLSTNEPAGAVLRLLGTDAGSKAEVHLGVSPRSRAGQLNLMDAEGRIVGRLP